MNIAEQKRLMERYGIKSVQSGLYSDGFFSCLSSIDSQNLTFFKLDHVIKRVEFAKSRKLDYDWLLNQLRNDMKKKIGFRK